MRKEVLEEYGGTVPIPYPRRTHNLLWLVGEIRTRRRSFTQYSLGLSRLSRRASLTWVEGEVPTELKAEVLYDIVGIPEQDYLQWRPAAVISDRSTRVELYVAHIGVDVVYRCSIYQDLWHGVWEVPWECKGRESVVAYGGLPIRSYLVLPQQETP